MEGENLCPVYVKDLFDGFNGRRNALIKALTTDFDKFFKKCDPEKGPLCLFGFSSGNWMVCVPAEQIPTDLPEPAMGINLARDMMQEDDWVALVSARSDAWLVSVTHYYSASAGLSRPGRIHLFNMINELPTVFETVFDTRRKQGMENASSSNKGRNRSMSSTEAERKRKKAKKGKKAKKVDEQAATEEGGDDDRVLCGCCGEKYTSDQFWMCCDFCEKSYHGRCVKITPARAEHISQYKCPSCRDPKKLSGP